MFDEHTLAARFGIDTHSVEFWRSSLDVIRGQIGEFEGLVGWRNWHCASEAASRPT